MSEQVKHTLAVAADVAQAELLEQALRHRSLTMPTPNYAEPFQVQVARHELEEVQLRQVIQQGADMLAESECSGMTPGPFIEPESATAYAQRKAREEYDRARCLHFHGVDTGEVR